MGAQDGGTSAAGSRVRGVHVTGWGAHVPGRRLSNDDVAGIVDTTDEWIRTRTGITHRHIASLGDRTEALAAAAGATALRRAGLAADDIDLIICASNTFTSLVPNTACTVQAMLGADHATAFDVQSACTGFVYALSVASALLGGGHYSRALVIGAEIMTRVVDWRDRTTCVLFGDGAGAVVLERRVDPGGISAFALGSDGRQGCLIHLPIGVQPQVEHALPASAAPILRMAGPEVFRFASRIIVSVVHDLAQAAGVRVEDIDLVIPHQANARILEHAAKHLGLPPERLYNCVAHFGNTSTASIPLALDHAVRAGRVRAGDLVALVGFGGGLSWGGCLIEWTAEPGPCDVEQPATVPGVAGRG